MFSKAVRLCMPGQLSQGGTRGDQATRMPQPGRQLCMYTRAQGRHRHAVHTCCSVCAKAWYLRMSASDTERRANFMLSSKCALVMQGTAGAGRSTRGAGRGQVWGCRRLLLGWCWHVLIAAQREAHGAKRGIKRQRPACRCCSEGALLAARRARLALFAQGALDMFAQRGGCPRSSPGSVSSSSIKSGFSCLRRLRSISCGCREREPTGSVLRAGGGARRAGVLSRAR